MKRRSLLQLSSAAALLSNLPAHASLEIIKRPRKLAEGQTVAIVAPASVTYESLQLQLAMEALEAMGLKAKVGEHVMDRFGYLAHSACD